MQKPTSVQLAGAGFGPSDNLQMELNYVSYDGERDRGYDGRYSGIDYLSEFRWQTGGYDFKITPEIARTSGESTDGNSFHLRTDVSSQKVRSFTEVESYDDEFTSLEREFLSSAAGCRRWAKDFATEVEGWQVDRVRDVLKTNRYFHAIHYPTAFQIDGRNILHGLAALAHRAGARIYQQTPVLSIDPSGIRKRIVTPSAKMRASHIVLAGNVHLGAPLQRLSDTLLPIWRYAALTAPLGDRLAEAITFQGSVTDTDGIDHYRIVGGDRLLWASPETTFAVEPKRLG